MFPWNIAKSAEALFSRWAVKRFCQFVLKKKLGQFILGDIDLDQLDVQLREGTIQLSDLALNVDCLNDKFGAAASVIIKEGSIGSLMVKMPWKGEGCLVEIDELELVLAPCLKNDSPAQNETCGSVQDDKDGLHSELQKLKNELVADAAKSSSGDVHEGVKTIAKMVKRLLTSFHVKVKNLLVAYDPCLENAEKNMGSHATLVLRILETECGTCVSDDANSNGGSNFLGISQLSNFVKFQEAILELLEVDDDDKKESLPCLSGTISGGYFSGHCPTNTTTPIMTGKSGGFSGNLKISIPWKNGSLDIHKVDADVHIDPVELRLQPSTIEWLLLSWETLKNLDKDGEGHMHHKPADSSTLFSTAHATEKPMPNCAGFPVDIPSLALQDSATETLLPRSLLISDWMPSSAQKSPKDGFEEELDFGSSVDQFFECFDGMRSFQSAIATSGMWNWTSSVFSAITAASSLASGSLHIPPEQQHVETSVKAAFAKISVVLSFNNEDQSHLSDPEGDQVNIHYLGAECKDISLCLQVSPQYKKFEGLVEGIVVADYYSSENSGMDFGLMTYTNNNNSKSHLIRQLQAEVQGALPPFASPAEDPNLDEINDLVATDCPFGTKGGIVKVTLVKTSGVTHCQFSESSSSADGSFTGPTSFSLKVPPFVLWVNFPLINMLLNLSVEVVKSVEMNIKRKEFPPQVSNEKQGSSHVDVRRGSTPCVTSLSSTERLRGDIMMTHVRVILCFPFETGKESKSYPSWDQFIVLDFSPPLALNKGITKKSNPASGANFQENNSSRPTSSLHFHVGDLEIYLVSCASMDEVGIDPCSKHNHKFSSQSILSMTSKTGSVSVISMLWQEGHVTGPWIARRAKLLATLEESRSRYQFVGKDYEFASVSTVKDLEDLHSQTRREIILSSASILHVQLSPVTINLGSSQYRVLHGLLNQVINGLSCMDPDAANSREGSPVYQTLLLVECDTVEILISPELRENIVGSMQSELPGSWYCLRLKIQKFELLSVSNIGGIGDAKFFWLAHGEGKLWGSINGVSEQEFLLISCSNSTMKRGDGKGSNALSSRLAGSDIVYLWEPESFHGFTSINVRCGTIVAVGGRLDWLDAISSFFTLSSPEIEEAGDDSTQKGDVNELCGSSFILNLVDIGLSYEPYLKSLVDGIEVLDSKSYSSSAKEKECGGEQYVACLLAASSLCLTNSTVANSIDNERKIRVQDLGLLLRNVSKLETLGGTYSVEHLRKVGYVRVVREALIEVFIRTNCKNGLLWEVECSKSHIYVETCHDTTSGLIRLAAQLSQLFAPDVEESVVHLQARWNNVQKAQERNNFLDEIKTFNGDSLPSTSQGHIAIVDTKSEPGSIGLMDEICEDAFHFDSNHTYQFDSSDTDICVSLDESLLGDARILNLETPKTSSVDSSFNGSVPIVGLENSQNSFLEEGYFTEFMEGYCLSELRPLMELSKSRQYMPEIPINRFINVGSGDPEKGNGGWYGDAFKIVENHISEASEQSGVNKFEEGNLPFIDHKRHEDTGNVTGRVLLKNIDIRCRMYAGSDWHDSMGDHEHSSNFHGRDKTALLEFLLSGMEFRYSTFPIGGVCVSKLSLSVEDFHLYDKSRDAPWKLVLGYYHSKNHPRESSSNALKLDLEAVRPDPLIPLEEYRLHIALLPILLHLHQSQLDFLINFFGSKSSSVDESPACHQDSDGSKLLHGLTIANEALLPYFQARPVLVRVDYSPRHVDLAALRSGKYVELVNLVPWKGVELLLKQVHAVGIYGWGSVCEAIVGEWLEDISQNQIHKILRGLPTIRSLVTVGSGAVKLVSLPVENYRRDRRVLKGMQRGTAAFLRSISLEAVGLGVHLAAGAHDILLQAEYILTSIPPSVPRAGRSKMKTNVRSDQPKDAQEGIQRAYESLSDGLGKSASALVRTPFKKYQSGAGAGSALASAIRGVPAAAIAPASACASAVHYTLLGFRNSLDPERKKESMEKYLGPTQSSDRD
ncbi:Autophagy-related protein 2 [Morella rubra]|uniref:Autophagy-related protein 2 n=1 Tax=Morella rubra TaxID=262757 RepID=A0A6A1V5C4_9ROSI|nr:Autophagy-related protein 2 [Morella rubra]